MAGPRAAARMFLTADGESGKAGGNEPSASTSTDGCGSRFRPPSSRNWAPTCRSPRRCDSPTAAANGWRGWGARAVRYDISYDPERGRWYLDASWKTSPEPVPHLDDLRAGRVLGVDLNADHLAACVLDLG